MGRGRAKSKKQTVAHFEDTGSGEEEKIPVYKRRGRPQKSLNDHIEEDEVDKTDVDNEDVKGSIDSKDVNIPAVTEKGRKRKRSLQAKGEIDSVKEENGDVVASVSSKSSTDDLKKTVGYRQIGSRRKNKPHRAAEAGVQSK